VSLGWECASHKSRFRRKAGICKTPVSHKRQPNPVRPGATGLTRVPTVDPHQRTWEQTWICELKPGSQAPRFC
jgi:hypothetical protein